MSLRSRIGTWWRAVSRPAALDREMQEELEHHIECYAEDLMRGGLSRDRAVRQARVELGSLAARKENCRLAWGTRFLDELRADLRYAVRMLAGSPGFTAIAIGSLVLGIGANTVIFNVAKHTLLDRLDVPHPEELRMLWWSQGSNGLVPGFWGYFNGTLGGAEVSTSFSYPVYRQLQRENHSLGSLFAFKPFGRMTATIDGRAQAVTTEMVSGNYYSSLGVRPAMGRPIRGSDDQAPGSGPVVVISDEFWARQFAHSPRVIGKVIDINLTPMTIIGVNPPGFTGAYGTHDSADISLPFSMQPMVAPRGAHSLLADTDLWWVLIMAREKPGVSDAAAAAQLNVALSAAVLATMPVKKGEQLPRLEVRDGSRGQNEDADWMAKPIWVLLALSGFVLLLACIGIYGMMAYSVSRRTNEIGIRMALGAPSRQVLRMVFGEALWMTAIGVAAGLAGALALGRVIASLLFGLRSWDPTTLAAAAALLLLVALAASWIPARRAASIDPMRALRHE